MAIQELMELLTGLRYIGPYYYQTTTLGEGGVLLEEGGAKWWRGTDTRTSGYKISGCTEAVATGDDNGTGIQGKGRWDAE